MSSPYYQELFSIITSSYSYLSSSFRSSSSSTLSSSSKSLSTAYFIDDKSVERRNLLVILLVSIFISISIGICLFATYFELMKQMNKLSILKNNLLFSFYSFNNIKKLEKIHTNSNRIYLTNDKNLVNRNIETGTYVYKNNQNDNLNDEQNSYQFDQSFENKLNRLGIVEILVYFCFRFCLVCSRLAVVALFWYLFNEWLFIAILAHVFLAFMLNFLLSLKMKFKTDISANDTRHINKSNEISNTEKNLLNNKNNNIKNERLSKLIDLSSSKSSSLNKHNFNQSMLTKIKTSQASKLNQYSTLLIICMLSFIDLFINQFNEIYHIKKVLIYYFLYFMQNLTVLTYWLLVTILDTQQKNYDTINQNERSVNSNIIGVQFKASYSNGSSVSPLSPLVFEHSNKFSEVSESSLPPNSLINDVSSSTYACYATLIYLCIVLLNIFGLVLKFLHLHILHRRYRKFF